MIKTPEERKDVTSIVDKWEHYIENRLDQLWAGQNAVAFTLPSDMQLTERVTDELVSRYADMGWELYVSHVNLGVSVVINVLAEA